MNNFFIILAFLPGLFGYPSREQAWDACKAWVSKGVSHSYTYNEWDSVFFADKKRTHNYTSRRCKGEGATNQVLGIESETVRRAKSWGMDSPAPDDWKIKKHFRY